MFTDICHQYYFYSLGCHVPRFVFVSYIRSIKNDIENNFIQPLIAVHLYLGN